jgi:hypothetical protein
MKAISDYSGEALRWTQPSGLKSSYELHGGDELLATLQFRGGTLAEAATADGQWTFKRQGFWHQQVTVRALGSDTDLAAFRPHWGGGGQFQAGAETSLEFAAANFWHSEWGWKDGDKVLISYRGPRGVLKAEAAMEIDPEGRHLRNLAMLAVLGWYLILLFGRDRATSAATTGTTVVTVMR